MAEITFRDDSTLGEGGRFVLVLRAKRPFGKIYGTTGLYRFYEGDHAKLGGADLQDESLDELKSRIKSRYGR